MILRCLTQNHSRPKLKFDHYNNYHHHYLLSRKIWRVGLGRVYLVCFCGAFVHIVLLSYTLLFVVINIIDVVYKILK